MPAGLLGAPGECPGTDAKNVPGNKAEFCEYLPIQRKKKQRRNIEGEWKQGRRRRGGHVSSFSTKVMKLTPLELS